MTGPPPAVAATRVAVRRALMPLAGTPGPAGAGEGPLVLVACSGGPDSLALAAATAFEAPKAGVRAGALVIDHRLQEGSAQVAASAADRCRALGLTPVVVLDVDVTPDGRGPEAAARHARHAALEAGAQELGACAVLLGHTRDDQAEQVLLGLARGSGARSLAGMAQQRDHLLRPFLSLSREQTRRACEAQGLQPWQDPHNDDPRFTRVRVRRALDVLEGELGPGLAAALARSADLARADADALDAYADEAAAQLPVAGPWPVARLSAPPQAVRTRVWRALAARRGVGALASIHVTALEGLLRRRGRGPVDLPGGWRVRRRGSGSTWRHRVRLNSLHRPGGPAPGRGRGRTPRHAPPRPASRRQAWTQNTWVRIWPRCW